MKFSAVSSVTYAISMAPFVLADGYTFPYTGTASTTQFSLNSEVGAGTACGASGLPNGQSIGGGPGEGPGLLYAAINQLGFGASSGPGGACGLCFALTPVSAAGAALSSQSLTFQIIDECPVTNVTNGVTTRNENCGQCTTSETNVFGQTWHFDIATDAMSSSQYSTFYNGVTDGQNWKEVQFTRTPCGTDNANPELKSWGCVETDGSCPNQTTSDICAGQSFSKRSFSERYFSSQYV